MTEIIKGASGQNRYLIMTEQDARQCMSSLPNLNFYRCDQFGEFGAVLGSLPITPKIELCHRLRMTGSNYDGYLTHQFRAGALQMYFSGTSHYTAPKNLLAENYESSFFFVPAISVLEYPGITCHQLAANQADSIQLLKRFNLDEAKAQHLVHDFYKNTGSMFKSGAPKLSLAKGYKNHLVTLLVEGDAIVIEKMKSLFIPQEEIISSAVGVSALRTRQEEDPVVQEAEPEESPYYFSIILIDKRSNPLAGVPYDLSFFHSENNKYGEAIHKIIGGSSDAEGYVEHKLPEDAKFALLEYAPYPTRPSLILKMALKVGELEDPNTELGMKSRLNHFGYHSGEEGIASNEKELFDAQFEGFQKTYGLSDKEGVLDYFENPTAIA